MQQPNENKKTIVLTGGHAGSTTHSFVKALLKNNNFIWDIHFIGAKSAIEGKEIKTLESLYLPKLGVQYHSVSTGRVQRQFTKYTIPSLLRIPLGFFETYKLLKKINPSIIISFGGFVGFPVVVLGKLLKIPVIIHEQTAAYGRANKLSAPFASKILLSREQSLKFFDKNKSVVVGNPISEATSNIKPKLKIGNPPLIFVTGGSRGSVVINENIAEILPQILKKYKVIHQVGSNDEEKYKILKEKLGELGKNYEVYGVIDPSDWSKFIEAADLIISRSGANITSDIMSTKRPSILIPIPWSFANEQMENAKIAQEFGIANILEQPQLNPHTLSMEIEKVINEWQEMVNKSKDKSTIDDEASQRMVHITIDSLK